MNQLASGAALRPAEPGDVPGILGLICELAEYEHAADEVHTTEAMLHETLFDTAPAAFCHVVVREGRVLAIALWFLNYSTWTGRHGIYLEDLIVTESERSHGYGIALMRELAAICIERGYARFEWSVLDWNEPSIQFYRRIGAFGLDEWTVQRLTGEPLARLGARP